MYTPFQPFVDELSYAKWQTVIEEVKNYLEMVPVEKHVQGLSIIGEITRDIVNNNTYNLFAQRLNLTNEIIQKLNEVYLIITPSQTYTYFIRLRNFCELAVQNQALQQFNKEMNQPTIPPTVRVTSREAQIEKAIVVARVAANPSSFYQPKKQEIPKAIAHSELTSDVVMATVVTKF